MTLVFITLYIMKLQIQRSNVVLSRLTRGQPGRQRNRANPQVAYTKDYWVLDHLLNELRDRLVKTKINFWHTDQFKQTKQENEQHIYDGNRADLQTLEEFTLEVKGWKARYYIPQIRENM